MVTECTVKRVGDLPFDFLAGTCGTFIIYSLPTILLCFDGSALTGSSKKCRSLTRRNDGPLNDNKDYVSINNIKEFELNKVGIPDSVHFHWRATMANYLGMPLILGGSPGNNKLEMLNTMKTPPAWISYEGTDYPYANT